MNLPGRNAPRPEASADQCVARPLISNLVAELQLLSHPLILQLPAGLWHGFSGVPMEMFLALQIWPAVDKTILNGSFA